MIQVLEISDVAALDCYRSDWARLLRETPGPSFFKSLDWLQTYWKHFGHEQKLRVLLVQEGGQVIGILPLVVKREATRAGRLRFLTYPLDGWGSFYSPIGGQPYRTLVAGLCHLRRTARDWDVLELRWVDAHGLDQGLTGKALERAGIPASQSVWEQTALLDVQGTWDDFQASRSSKWRNNLRRWERRAAELGSVEYVRYRPGGSDVGEDDPRWDLYEACESIAQRSWQGHSSDGTTLSHRQIRDYLRDTHATAARCGALDLNLLLIDGRPVAFAYNYYHRGYVYGLRIGYDSALAACGIGNLMYISALRDSFERGDELYDLGPGSLDCKRYLHTRVQPLMRYSYYAPTALRAQLVRLKRWTDHWRDTAPQPDDESLSAAP